MNGRTFFSFLLLVVLAASCATHAQAEDAPHGWPTEGFMPVTPERIATLPAAERVAWQLYFEVSQTARGRLRPPTVPDFSPNQPLSAPHAGATHSQGLKLKAEPAWYRSEEAQTIADRVVQAQGKSGGWKKGNDYTQPLPPTAEEKTDVWSGGTFDNNATTSEMLVLSATQAGAGTSERPAAWREAFLRGLHYILQSQYPNGGFPQIYPLVGGYHDAITFNDDVMIEVLSLLRDIAAGNPEYVFVPEALRARCAAAGKLGLRCVLRCQMRMATGELAVWCQQYDALTLSPCAGRNFEPMASSAGESAGVVSFLMAIPHPSAEIIDAVSGAAAWFERVALHDVTWVGAQESRQLVARAGAPLLWARFYESGTDKPIFGDRDRTIHYAIEEISAERRRGYAWYGTWPTDALKEFKAWSVQVRPNS